jgi:hypothetical protein
LIHMHEILAVGSDRAGTNTDLTRNGKQTEAVL